MPFGALAIHLTLPSSSGATLGDVVRLRKMFRSELYAGLAIRALRTRRQRGKPLVPAIRRAMRLLASGRIREFAAELRRAGGAADAARSYAQWIAVNEDVNDPGFEHLRRQLGMLSTKPLISVLMPVYETPVDLLRQAIESVRRQVYDNWELCIADDCSSKPEVRALLEDLAAADPRIKLVFRERNGGISEATNSAFGPASGDWIALLDHDDLLAPDALAEVALRLAERPDAEIVYSDEDKVDAKGRRYEPYFKPEFSRELLRSQNYFNHLTVHRAANIRAIGGWRPAFDGSQDYDLNLRIVERIDPATIVHIPKVLYHWRATGGSTALYGEAKSYAYGAGLRALEEHLERLGLPAVAEQAPSAMYYRIRFKVPTPAPRVSLIIPTRDQASLVRNCVESIRRKTTYENYEIVVVDNGSSEPEALAYLKEIAGQPNLRVLRCPGPFNFSAINNFAVRATEAAIVGLLNNDIEVISPDWLTEMVSWAVQPDIGCVGAKLYYADETIQHAGVILGIKGVAGHSHRHFSRDQDGYFSRLKLLQNLSAVTGACLVVRREVYEQVGGLNEIDLQVAFNDVDFCLKVREAGYMNVWTPYAELYHLESISRGPENSPEKVRRFNREVEHMMASWDLRHDPFYSPHLTLEREDFSLRVEAFDHPAKTIEMGVSSRDRESEHQT